MGVLQKYIQILVPLVYVRWSIENTRWLKFKRYVALNPFDDVAFQLAVVKVGLPYLAAVSRKLEIKIEYTLERISGEAGSHHSEVSNCHFPRHKSYSSTRAQGGIQEHGTAATGVKGVTWRLHEHCASRGCPGSSEAKPRPSPARPIISHRARLPLVHTQPRPCCHGGILSIWFLFHFFYLVSALIPCLPAGLFKSNGL